MRNAITLLVLLCGGLLVAREAAIRRGGDPDALRGTLSRAMAVGDADEAIRLLREGAPSDGREESSGATPLLAAVVNGDERVVRALIASGARADVGNRAGFTPLMFAVLGGKVQIAEELLAAGADVNGHSRRGGCCTLRIAVERGDRSAVRLLLRAGGADPSLDGDGRRVAAAR